jgi:hypothetical protein
MRTFVASEKVGPLTLLAFFTLAPIALAFAASRVLPYSVWGTRHLIIVAAPYTLLCGAALARTRPAWLKSSALLLLSCWLISVGALTLVRREGAYIWCAWGDLAARAARDEANDAEDLLNNSESERAPFNVYAFEDLVAYHLWFALEGRERFARLPRPLAKGRPRRRGRPRVLPPARLRGCDGRARRSVGRRAELLARLPRHDLGRVAPAAQLHNLARLPRRARLRINRAKPTRLPRPLHTRRRHATLSPPRVGG